MAPTDARPSLNKYVIRPDRLTEDEEAELAAELAKIGERRVPPERMLVFDRCSDEIHAMRLEGLVAHLDGAIVDGVHEPLRYLDEFALYKILRVLDGSVLIPRGSRVEEFTDWTPRPSALTEGEASCLDDARRRVKNWAVTRRARVANEGRRGWTLPRAPSRNDNPDDLDTSRRDALLATEKELLGEAAHAIARHVATVKRTRELAEARRIHRRAERKRARRDDKTVAMREAIVCFFACCGVTGKRLATLQVESRRWRTPALRASGIRPGGSRLRAEQDIPAIVDSLRKIEKRIAGRRMPSSLVVSL